VHRNICAGPAAWTVKKEEAAKQMAPQQKHAYCVLLSELIALHLPMTVTSLFGLCPSTRTSCCRELSARIPFGILPLLQEHPDVY